MKKTYITPTFIVEEIVDDMNILAESPTEPGRGVTGGGPTGEIQTTTGGSGDEDSGETAAKGSNLFLSYDDEW